MLLTIIASSERPLSTTDVCQVTRNTLGATAHHVRSLAKRGFIEWAGERRVRGALQTYYRITADGQSALLAAHIDSLIQLAGYPAFYADGEARDRLEALLEDVRPRVAAILRD